MLELQLQKLLITQVISVMDDLTHSEYRVFEALVKFVKENKDTPTYQELGEILGMSKQAVSQFIMKLDKKGYVKRVGRFKIRLTYKDAEIVVENIARLRPALEELKQLLDDGLISKEIYEEKVKTILKLNN